MTQISKLFIAGASGMLGRAIIGNALSQYPGLLIRGSHFTQSNTLPCHERLELIRGDLRDADTARRMCRGCDAMIVAAAHTGGAAESTNTPWNQVNHNLFINANLFEAAHKEGVRRAIIIGSATSYQDHAGPIREDQLDWNIDPIDAHLGVGWVSRYIEKLGLFWHRQSGMDVILIRAANIYGPWAKFNPKVSNFIPALIRKAVDCPDNFDVWGSPNTERDVIFVEDFANATLRLTFADTVKFDVFNIGSGQPTSVNDVVNLAIMHSGHQPKEISYSADQPTTARSRVLDCAKIGGLGWKCQWSLNTGIRETLTWWQQNRQWWPR